MKRHQFDGDVGNGGGIGREASTADIEIGQSAGIEFGLRGRRGPVDIAQFNPRAARNMVREIRPLTAIRAPMTRALIEPV